MTYNILLSWLIQSIGTAYKNRIINFVVSSSTGVLVDLTDSYTLPFYLAGISFFISAFFIFIIPLAMHINNRSRKRNKRNGSNKAACTTTENNNNT